MRRLKTLPILATLLMLPCCSAPPPPPAAPPVTAPPSPPPPPLPPPATWQDAPLTPGTWTYRADAQRSTALYGNRTAPPVFTMACDRQKRAIRLDRLLPAPTTTSGTMRIITSFGDAQWPASAIDQGQPLRSVLLASTDPALDKVAYSRGRIMIETSATERLILPSWPEVARVIEDCRG